MVGRICFFINRTIVPQGADMVFDYINAFRDKATADGDRQCDVGCNLADADSDDRQCVQPDLARQFATALDDAVLVYWALLTFGPLSLGVGLSVVIGQVQVVGGSEWLRVITTVSFITVLLWGLYRFVPNRFVPASHALVGAAVTAFCLETARFFIRLVHGQL